MFDFVLDVRRCKRLLHRMRCVERGNHSLFDFGTGQLKNQITKGEWIVRRSSTGVERLVPVPAVELTGAHMLGNVVAATAVASSSAPTSMTKSSSTRTRCTMKGRVPPPAS